MVKAKLTEGLIDRAKWYWLAEPEPTTRGMARRLGVHHTQIYRWRLSGRRDRIRGKYSIYARFERELRAAIDARKERGRELARKKVSKKPQRASKAPVLPKIFFTDATLEEFEAGRVVFPGRDEIPAGLTTNHWPPKTGKEFLQAKRAAWLSRDISDVPWWKKLFRSDPNSWVKPDTYDGKGRLIDHGNRDAHDDFRFIVSDKPEGGVFRGAMSEEDATEEDN